jgi:serine/threonine protein kinase/tetratricopeptide (TPR) repeat protein
MAINARLVELLVRWEDLRAQGRDASPEELCAGCPDLARELERRIGGLNAFDARFGPEGPPAHNHFTGQGLFDTLGRQRPRGQLASEVPEAEPVANRWQILSELGRGSMGIVYLARDLQRDTLVALKTMQRGDPAALIRFKQEFRALAGLVHPNLAALYDLVSDGDGWYFTMELVDGVDFLTYVRSAVDPPYADAVGRKAMCGQRPLAAGPAAGEVDRGFVPEDRTEDPPATSVVGSAGAGDRVRSLTGVVLSPSQLNRLRASLGQLAEGLTALHEAGRVHRDLKPSNVLVTGQGRVVILDFGLAAELDPAGLHKSSESHVLGTVAYMAPEQAASLPVSPASDWYSVGVMIYEALTGLLPFLGRPLEVLTGKQRSEPRPPRESVPDVPDDLNTLCVDLLRKDPGARPSGREIRRRLGSQPGGSGHNSPPPAAQWPRTDLIGRAHHLQCLDDAFTAVRRGETIALFVHGCSGAGKTVLVQSFLARLVERNEAVVLTGRCYEQESVPYKALDSLVDALGRYLRRLPPPDVQALLPRDVLPLTRVFPVLRRVEAVAATLRRTPEIPDPQELRRRAFAALRELLARLGDRRPVLVLAIDDLQWGDADSAALLSDLVRPPQPPVLLLLGCYRDEDAATSPFLRALVKPREREDAAVDRRELAVGALTEAEARDLALLLLGRDDPAAAARAGVIARESGGNPFFVAELVHHCRVGDGHAGRSSEAEITLEEVLWGRIRRLPDGARRLLEAIAVSGRPLRQASACRTAGLGADGLASLSLLRTNHLVRSTGPCNFDDIETYHDRIRETVIKHLTPEVLSTWHHDLARELEDAGGVDPETLAVHFESAGETAKAGRYYEEAAAAAAEALAFDRAAKLYRLALEFRPGDDAEAPKLRSRLGDALADAGRGPEAAAEYLQAAVGATVAEALEFRRRAALQYLSSGHVDEGLETLSTVLDTAGLKLPDTPRRALLSVWFQRLRVRWRGLGFRLRDSSQVSAEQLIHVDICWVVGAGLSMIDPIRGAVFQTRNLLLALRAGEAYRIVRALAIEAAHLAMTEDRGQARAERFLQAADTLAREVAHHYARGVVLMAKGIVEYSKGHWRSARTLFGRAEEIFRGHCTGVAWELDTTQFLSLWALDYMGELAELSRCWPILVKESQERGDRYAVTNLCNHLLVMIRLAADDPEGAEEELQRALGQWSHRGFHVQHCLGLAARAEVRLYQGDDSAWELLTGHWRELEDSLLLHVRVIRVFMWHLRSRAALLTAARAKDPRPFWRAAERDARRLERERLPWAEAHARLIRGGVAAARGDRSTAEIEFAAAAARYEGIDMHLYAVAARSRRGQILGGSEGRALTEDADSWMIRQEIRNPARMVSLATPGFPSLDS